MSDKKDAVSIGVTLSTQIIAASLAMIAVVGAFTSFTIDKKNVGLSYYIITGLAFLSFVISIFCGGKGIDKARKDGFVGNWNLSSTKGNFNLQSLAAFAGIIFFIISMFLGEDKSDETEQRIHKQEKAINRLELSDSLNRLELKKLTFKGDSLQKLFRTIQTSNQPPTIPNTSVPVSKSK